jgi:hypothetical protein
MKFVAKQGDDAILGDAFGLADSAHDSSAVPQSVRLLRSR